MNSFYGGREGAPFIIRKSYKNIPEMTTAFQDGLSYSEVKFGEFVIINTEDKNHPDNGKVFRRNFMGGQIECYTDTKNETGKYIKADSRDGNGAELIGSIVGPAGGSPHFVPMPGIVSELALDEEGFAVRDEEGNLTYIDVEYDLDTIQDKYKAYDTISASGEFSIPKGNLVPGKEGDNFTDDIKWDSYSVRSLHGDDARVFVDFKMPYDVIEFDASTVDAYYNRNNETADFDNLNLVVRHKDDKGEHPFYQKWQINIPKGIHGDSIENLRVDVDEENRAVLKYEIRSYDAKAEGETKTIELGDYNMIDNIVLENDGKLTIEYSHDDDYVREGNDRLTWIESSSYNKETGLLSIDLNNDAEGRQQETRIEMKCAADLLVEDGNKLILQYNTETEGVKHTKDLGRFVYQGNEEPEDLITGGLWIETIDI